MGRYVYLFTILSAVVLIVIFRLGIDLYNNAPNGDVVGTLGKLFHTDTETRHVK